jgi:hypothetical protein
MNPTIVIALISAVISGAVGFGAAWKWQGSTINELKVEYANTKLADQQSAHTVKERNLEAVVTAQNHATARVAVIKRDADSARSALDGLRAQSAAALQSAAKSLDACTATAATYDQLLNSCGDRYQALGNLADRHVNDIQTLTEAWPK